MKVGHEVAVLGNAVIWAIAILLVAIILQVTPYFNSIVGSLCVAALISIILVARVNTAEKRKEWYEDN